MEFTRAVTAGLFGVLFVVLAAGTLQSPMSESTLLMVVPGLFVYGVLALLLGVKHGEYRRAGA